MRNENQIIEGTTHSKRNNPALAVGYANVDEFSFEDLLVFANGFSHLLKYFNEKNELAGDWSSFWLDETMVIAEIVNIDIAKVENIFKQKLDKSLLFRRNEKKAHYLWKAMEQVYFLANLFEQWLTKLIEVEKLTNSQLKLRETFDHIFANYLNEGYSNAVKIESQIAEIHANKPELKYDKSLLKHYTLIEIGLTASSDLTDVGDSDGQSDILVNSIILKLEHIFNSFSQLIYSLKDDATQYMQQSLLRNDHLPHIGLYLAFLKLYSESQDNINQLNERFIEFYYRNKLNLKPLSFEKDKVYLIAKLQENVVNALVAKGERFVAGEDSLGTTIIYSADENSRLNQVNISKLCNVFVAQQNLSVRGRAIPYVTGIYSLELPTKIHTEEVSETELKIPVFGVDQSKLSGDNRIMNDARLGFAFSSNNFFLESGRRDVDMQFIFTAESFKHLVKQIDNFSASTGKMRTEIVDNIFMHAFDFTLTATESWYLIRKYSIYINEEAHSILARFTIPENAPAIIAYNPEIHGGNFQTPYPVFRCLLNSDSYIYAYSQLQKMVLDRIDISVEVTNHNTVKVYNHFGQMDENSIYAPFGPTPRKGDFFIIGSNEVFNKELKELSVDLQWFELPENGFGAHYEKYSLGIDNTSFKVKISILNEGKWKPTHEEQQKIELFAQDEEQNLLDSLSIDNLDISRIWRSFDSEELGKPKDYTTLTRSGFLKLELCDPEFSFGHDVYPAVLSKMLSKKGRGPFASPKPDITGLNQPYSPQIQRLSLNYKSESTFTFSATGDNLNQAVNEIFYHLYPFGEVRVFPNLTVREINVLPEFDFEGAFYIGLSNVEPPQTVSFLFVMKETSTESSEERIPLIVWEYLANDHWTPLEQTKIYIDETDGLRQTGSIQVELPAEIKNNNGQVDGNLFWLRVKAANNTNVAASVMKAYTGVFTATLDTTQEYDKEVYGRSLPALAIERAAGNVEGIQTVTQPLPSFNGVKDETTPQFYLRVSEFLKHKNRAITASDIEKIVLQKFRQIYKVSCFPNTSSRGMNQTGNVLVVLLPYPQYSLTNEQLRVGNKLLVEIKNYLSKIASPFVNFEVRNPEYEYLKVVCSVKFKSGFSQGYYIRELNDNLYSYLSGDVNVALGGKVHISDVLSFLRSLPYIDIVGKLSLIHVAKDLRDSNVKIDTAKETEYTEFVEATKPWAILSPFKEHYITVIQQTETGVASPSGIGQLRISSDFIID